MKVRRAKKITSRVSSVTNGFVQAVLPEALPDPIERLQVLTILEINPNKMTCAYCGDTAHHQDHLNAYVSKKRPSGYLNEARNLVPACGPCNTSKGGKPWRAWLFSDALGSPKTRGVQDLEARAARLQRLVDEFELRPIDLASLVDKELWAFYWKRLETIERLMFDAQHEAIIIREQITGALLHRVVQR